MFVIILFFLAKFSSNKEENKELLDDYKQLEYNDDFILEHNGTCPEGKYGDDCDKFCPQGCNVTIQNCDKQNGTCHYCKVKYFPHEGDCYNCSKHCISCISDKNCTECEKGHRGIICEQECNSTCEICDKDTGDCTKCKNISQYGKDCDDCPQNCKQTEERRLCNETTGECYECLPNFTGDFCKECKEGKYGYPTCSNNCSVGCEDKKCNKTDGTCKCVGKYYGPKCDTNNTDEHCKEIEHEKGFCKQCDEGYYPEEQNCIKCPDNCKDDTCNSTGYCSECKEGFWGAKCENNCSTHCTSKNCSQKDGSCKGCEQSYFGANCSESCINCNFTGEKDNCDQDTGHCDFCKTKLHYGDHCEHESTIDNCIEVNKTNGLCLKCNATFFLKDNACSNCTTDCKHQLCKDETGACTDGCEDRNKYGDYCNIPCPQNCVDSPVNPFVCEPSTGDCKSCKSGFYGNKCNVTCDSRCKVKECDQSTGSCTCEEKYYYNTTNQKCSLCPNNCKTCMNSTRCKECENGFYSENCKLKCNSTCDQEKGCEFLDGKCKECVPGTYGLYCENNCSGCYYSCSKEKGFCLEHFCKEGFYIPSKCQNTCSEKCVDNKCDLYSGYCIKCKEDDKYGKDCSLICKNCENDKRADCCYAKETLSQENGLITPILTNDEANQNYFFINVELGSQRKKLKIILDFNSRNPLTIFDKAKVCQSQDVSEYEIKKNTTYNSSESSTFQKDGNSEDISYTGISFNKVSRNKDTLYLLGDGESISYTFENFTFFSCVEYTLSYDFSDAGEVNGIVGLGFYNLFSEFLYFNQTNFFPKNLVGYILGSHLAHKEPNKKYLHIGDYPSNIKRDFSKLGSVILYDIDITETTVKLSTYLKGFAYSFKRAYKYVSGEEKVRIEFYLDEKTDITLNKFYQQFFEKMYFGDLFKEGICSRDIIMGTTSYTCKPDSEKTLKSLPKFGLIINEYIYYLSFNILFTKVSNAYLFNIKLRGQGSRTIKLGRSFFNEFSMIINNGNHTLNIFGDVKKVSVPLVDVLNNLIEDNISNFSPGKYAIIVVSAITLIIIVIKAFRIYSENKGESDTENFYDNEENEDDDDDINEDEANEVEDDDN